MKLNEKKFEAETRENVIYFLRKEAKTHNNGSRFASGYEITKQRKKRNTAHPSWHPSCRNPIHRQLFIDIVAVAFFVGNILVGVEILVVAVLEVGVLLVINEALREAQHQPETIGKSNKLSEIQKK